jgi:hypothetical protein
MRAPTSCLFYSEERTSAPARRPRRCGCGRRRGPGTWRGSHRPAFAAGEAHRGGAATRGSLPTDPTRRPRGGAAAAFRSGLAPASRRLESRFWRPPRAGNKLGALLTIKIDGEVWRSLRSRSRTWTSTSRRRGGVEQPPRDAGGTHRGHPPGRPAVSSTNGGRATSRWAAWRSTMAARRPSEAGVGGQNEQGAQGEQSDRRGEDQRERRTRPDRLDRSSRSSGW